MKKVKAKIGGGVRGALFGGRTIEVRVFVNTDEGIETVADRVTDAAKGPHRRQIIATAGEVPVEDAKEMREATFARLAEKKL